MTKSSDNPFSGILSDFSALLDKILSSSPGNQSTPPTQSRGSANFITDTLSTAAHEAGHAVAAWSSTHVARLVSIRVQKTVLQTSGLVTFVPLDQGADSLWATTTIHLSGIAAEGIIIGSVKSIDASADLLNARNNADRIAALGPRHSINIPWEIDYNDTTRTDIGSLYANPPDAVTRGILNTCYRKARHIIKCRRALVDKLLLTLMRKPTLDAHELSQVLGRRPMRKLQLGSRPVFRLT